MPEQHPPDSGETESPPSPRRERTEQAAGGRVTKTFRIAASLLSMGVGWTLPNLMLWAGHRNSPDAGGLIVFAIFSGFLVFLGWLFVLAPLTMLVPARSRFFRVRILPLAGAFLGVCALSIFLSLLDRKWYSPFDLGGFALMAAMVGIVAGILYSLLLKREVERRHRQ